MTIFRLGEVNNWFDAASRSDVDTSALTVPILDQLRESLDGGLAMFSEDRVPDGLANVNNRLAAIARHVSRAEWEGRVLPLARAHPFAAAVMQCPLTRHSFTRPRGYPGDADLLDILYRHPDATTKVEAASELGRKVFLYTSEVRASRAVRNRRRRLAQVIDETCASRSSIKVLSIACGHLREIELSENCSEGRVSLTAVDQDQASLAVAEKYSDRLGRPVETHALSVRDLLRDRHDLGPFDLVYAAGLYDYLDQRTAARLTAVLFSKLAQGGRILVTNFLAGVWEAPYLETFMRWPLRYRTRGQIEALAVEIAPETIAQQSFIAEGAGCIGYLELRRA